MKNPSFTYQIEWFDEISFRSIPLGVKIAYYINSDKALTSLCFLHYFIFIKWNLFNIVLILSVVLSKCFAVVLPLLSLLSVTFWSKSTLNFTESTICMLTKWIRSFRSNRCTVQTTYTKYSAISPFRLNQISYQIKLNQINSSKFKSTSSTINIAKYRYFGHCAVSIVIVLMIRISLQNFWFAWVSFNIID